MYSENKDSENKTPFSASGLNAWAFKGLIITRLKIRREWKLICQEGFVLLKYQLLPRIQVQIQV